MNWSVVAKVGISVVGLALITLSTTYAAHPTAPVMAYVATISGSVGSYLVGLFQSSPTAK